MSEQMRVAIITGGSGEIGRTVARRLAEDGYATVIGYRSNAAEAGRVITEIEAAGGKSIAMKVDVAVGEEVAQFFQKTLDTFGRLDAVIHSAEIMPNDLIAKGNLELFDQVIATNLRGAFFVLSQAAQHVADGGRIVTFSSSILGLSPPTYGPYAASKAGVEAMVRVLANELRGRSVTVNTIAPGPIPTELLSGGKTEPQNDWFRKLLPLRRLGKPEDIRNVIGFLCSPDGGWINAQLVRASGGFA